MLLKPKRVQLPPRTAMPHRGTGAVSDRDERQSHSSRPARGTARPSGSSETVSGNAGTYVSGSAQTVAAAPSVPPTSVAPLPTPSGSPNDFNLFRNTSLASTLPAGVASTINEPSVSNNGPVVLYTGNTYAAVSSDGGSTYSYVDPATFPVPPGMVCCVDQSSLYAANQDITIWAIMYLPDSSNNNIIRLAVANGQSGVLNNVYNTYDISAQAIGFPAGDSLDYPQIATGAANLYLTANVVQATGDILQAAILRFPLSALAAGGPVTPDYFTDPDSANTGFGPPVSGASTTMYWGAHINSTVLRLYTWSEGAPPTSILTTDIAHSSYTEMGTGNVWGNCPAPDGTAWCSRPTSRIRAAWVANGIVGFMWMAMQDASFPFPYVFVLEISQASGTNVGEPLIFNPNYAIMFPAIAVNQRGGLGLSLQFGGGSYYPSSAIGISDDVTPGLPQWTLYEATRGTAGADDWGDYLTVHPAGNNGTVGNSWVATGYTLQSGVVTPAFYWFGRNRDAPF